MPASVTYRGTTITGDGEPRFKSIEGLDGYTSSVGADPLFADHGGVPRTGWAQPAEFQVVFQLIGDDDDERWTQLRDILAAFSPLPDGTEEPLIFVWPGWPQLQIDCAPTMRQAEQSVVAPLVTVRMVASDPARYAVDPTETVIPVFVGSGGLDYPVDYPKDYGEVGTGATVLVPNDGTWQTWPRIEISGPTSGVVDIIAIENVTDGLDLRFTADGGLEIAAGSTLVIDTHPARRGVTFTDGASRWNTVASSEWWPVQPGGAELRLRAGGDTDGVTATVHTRDAYL